MVDHRPVFVLACGWRSGSTLVQRLLSTHSDIQIWGENGGVCDYLAATLHMAESRAALSEQGAMEFKARGSGGWIANWTPPVSAVTDGLARFMVAYLGLPAQRLGKSRWGFKEVRHGIRTGQFLQRLFPESRVVLLVRNPADCLASARGTEVPGRPRGLLHEVGGADAFLTHWSAVAQSFATPMASQFCLVRYEDLVTDHASTIGRLAVYLDVELRDFQLDVLIYGALLGPSVTRRQTHASRPRLALDSALAVGRVPVTCLSFSGPAEV
jgi:hypothetical protein